jgi:selenocysteine-specific elongation factor
VHVVATAGHVDHGKSTLVRALTGMEPDRWAEEKRRGMTIDLGFAWTSLPDGEVVGFVDVPGHQRFLGNMLAGLGPAPAVLFVVAADEGWCRQSAEHLAAIDGLDLRHGLLAVTRSDLADPAAATAQALEHLGRSSLGAVPAVAVSGRTGVGLDALRHALSSLVRRTAEPDPSAAVRMWVDRAFTVRGAGTVVTGTLEAGALSVGDSVWLRGREVTVRGLQSLGQERDRVAAVARLAVNLRGVARDEVGRGDVLLSSSWDGNDCVDVRLSVAEVTEQLVLHVGTAAVPVRVRPLSPGAARLQLAAPLPLRVGDRGLLRDPAGQRLAASVLVLDPHPPALAGRGAAARRGNELLSPVTEPVHEPSHDASADLGLAESAIRALEDRFTAHTFDAPSRAELKALGLTRQHLAAALGAGRLLVLGEVVLPPYAAHAALPLLADLPAPFAVADARSALGVRRQVAVALLEHLDGSSRTVRLSGGLRRVVSAPGGASPPAS